MTKVSDYHDLIVARAQLRGWELPTEQLDALKARLKNLDHAEGPHPETITGPFHPIGITMWLGHDLKFNYEEAVAWLKDEAEARGLKFEDWIMNSPGIILGKGRLYGSIAFYPGSEQSGEPSISACRLDRRSFQTRAETTPQRIRDTNPSVRWPGLEVFWLACLNFDFFLSSDSAYGVNSLRVLGLDVAPNCLPKLGRRRTVGGYAVLLEPSEVTTPHHACAPLAFIDLEE